MDNIYLGPSWSQNSLGPKVLEKKQVLELILVKYVWGTGGYTTFDEIVNFQRKSICVIRTRVNSLESYLTRLRISSDVDKIYSSRKLRLEKQIKTSQEEAIILEKNLKICKEIIKVCPELKKHFEQTGDLYISTPEPCPIEEKSGWINTELTRTKYHLDSLRRQLKYIENTLDKNIKVYDKLKNKLGGKI